MKKRISILGTILLLAASIAVIGCDNGQDASATSGGNAVEVAAIYPADGSSGISTGTSVALTFTGPVDTLSVMRNLYLAGGQPMHEWEDSLMHYGGMGMMGGSGMHDHMMHWIDSIGTPGVFHWNARRDSCEFVPNSSLVPGTEYLCVLYEEGMHDYHGGMMGHSFSPDSGYVMSHFSTHNP